MVVKIDTAINSAELRSAYRALKDMKVTPFSGNLYKVDIEREPEADLVSDTTISTVYEFAKPDPHREIKGTPPEIWGLEFYRTDRVSVPEDTTRKYVLVHTSPLAPGKEFITVFRGDE